MKKPLLDVIFASEKRKGVLLLLRDGAKEMDFLLRSLNTNRQALLPQMKILEEHYLIDHYDDTYELTTVGRLTVDEMASLVGTLDTFDIDIEYWGTRNLDFIPLFLLKRMNDLRECKIITPPITELYSLHKTYHEKKITKYVYTFGNLFYPDYRTKFTEMIDNSITINYIISEDLLNKVRTEYYEDFKVFIKSKYFNLYVYNKKMNFLFFTFDDYHIVINSLKKDGDFDNKYMLCNTEDALKWGKDLFEYYLKDSTLITEI
jgi:predicted transcriptional regulator